MPQYGLGAVFSKAIGRNQWPPFCQQNLTQLKNCACSVQLPAPHSRQTVGNSYCTSVLYTIAGCYVAQFGKVSFFQFADTPHLTIILPL